ncbi:hypothetical protein SNB82_01270, partial [Escherichia coli]|nr:hypothetical protein [Escherichia coli]MEA0522941.1 hypothetical protein [Escherichia coli]
LRKAALAVRLAVIPALELRKAVLAVQLVAQQQVAQQQVVILAQVLQVVQRVVIPVLVIRGVRYLLLLHLVERVPGPVTVMVKVL